MSTKERAFFLLGYSINDDRPFPEHRNSEENLAVIVATSEAHAIERLESWYEDEDEARNTIKLFDVIVQSMECDADKYPFLFLERELLRGSGDMEILIMI